VAGAEQKMTALPQNPDEAPRAAAGAERFALLDGLRGSRRLRSFSITRRRTFWGS